MSTRSESDGFSEMARLGDLSVYTCQQLLDAIQHMNRQIENLGDFQRVTVENDQVLVAICYDLQGNFSHIEREVWKNHGMDLNHTQDH